MCICTWQEICFADGSPIQTERSINEFNSGKRQTTLYIGPCICAHAFVANCEFSILLLWEEKRIYYGKCWWLANLITSHYKVTLNSTMLDVCECVCVHMWCHIILYFARQCIGFSESCHWWQLSSTNIQSIQIWMLVCFFFHINSVWLYLSIALRKKDNLVFVCSRNNKKKSPLCCAIYICDFFVIVSYTELHCYDLVNFFLPALQWF